MRCLFASVIALLLTACAGHELAACRGPTFALAGPTPEVATALGGATGQPGLAAAATPKVAIR